MAAEADAVRCETVADSRDGQEDGKHRATIVEMSDIVRASGDGPTGWRDDPGGEDTVVRDLDRTAPSSNQPG